MSIKTICNGLKRYYESLDVVYESLFEVYCNDNGFDTDEVLEEFDNEPKDCVLVDFDGDFPFCKPPESEAAKQKQILDIIQKCYNNPSISFTVKMPRFDKSLFEITEQELKDVKELYAEQCPLIWNCGMENDAVFLYLLTIGRKRNFSYLQHLVDDYFFSRIKHIDQTHTEDQWSKGHRHFKLLKEIRAQLPYKGLSQPAEMCVGAVRSFGKRCCPKLLLNPMIEINDSMELIIKYIDAAVGFIRTLLDNRFKNRAICPFQLDFCIASGEPRSKDHKVSIYDKNKDNKDNDDDDDDDDEKEAKDTGFFDCVGDIKAKLEKNKLNYGVGEFDADVNQDIKTRVFVQIFNEFVKKFGKAENKNEYPHNRRFVTFIDRRKTEDEKGDIDPAWMYEPPINCRNIPHDVVPEWYINASRTSLLPNMEYGDGKEAEEADDEAKDKTKEQLLKSNITSSFHCKGSLLTLSFIVKEADAVKMYLYWNGQIIRLQAEDIKPVFKTIFNMKWKDDRSSNHAFVKSKEIDELIQQIEQKVTDKYYESFCNSYK